VPKIHPETCHFTTYRKFALGPVDSYTLPFESTIHIMCVLDIEVAAVTPCFDSDVTPTYANLPTCPTDSNRTTGRPSV
jgi:hypothetical protein